MSRKHLVMQTFLGIVAKFNSFSSRTEMFPPGGAKISTKKNSRNVRQNHEKCHQKLWIPASPSNCEVFSYSFEHLLNRSRISSKRHRHFQALRGNVAHGSLAGQNLKATVNHNQPGVFLNIPSNIHKTTTWLDHILLFKKTKANTWAVETKRKTIRKSLVKRSIVQVSTFYPCIK